LSGVTHLTTKRYSPYKRNRLMAGMKPINSCKNIFKRLEIFTLPCEYIFSLMIFIARNQEMFPTNSHIHTVNTRDKNQLHRPIPNLSCFQKSAYYAGIKIFHSLPWNLTTLIHKQVQFKVALKKYLSTHSFYSVDEFILSNNSKCMQCFPLVLSAIIHLLYSYMLMCGFIWTFHYCCEPCSSFW
jgi:hypothetical protein